MIFLFFVLSLFVQRKIQKAGVLKGRAHKGREQKTPFPGMPLARI